MLSTSGAATASSLGPGFTAVFLFAIALDAQILIRALQRKMSEILCRWLNDEVGMSRRLGTLFNNPASHRQLSPAQHSSSASATSVPVVRRCQDALNAASTKRPFPFEHPPSSWAFALPRRMPCIIQAVLPVLSHGAIAHWLYFFPSQQRERRLAFIRDAIAFEIAQLPLLQQSTCSKGSVAAMDVALLYLSSPPASA